MWPFVIDKYRVRQNHLSHWVRPGWDAQTKNHLGNYWVSIEQEASQIFQLFKWRNCVLLNNTSWTALTQISFHKLMRISFKLSKVRLIRRNISSGLIFKFNKDINDTI
jgi:hypothetical protein